MVGSRRENNMYDDSGYGSCKSASIPNQMVANRPPRMIASEASVTIEAWAAQKDRFRVVATGLPMAWPVILRNSSPQLEELFQTRVRSEVVRVLAAHSISFLLARIDDWRQEPHDSPIHTISIESDDSDTTSWKDASKEVLSVFMRMLPLDFKGQTQVEIRNKYRMYNDVSRVLPNDPFLVQSLQRLKGEVSKTVHEYMSGSCSSIAYHTRVPHGASRDTLGKTTIIVFCYPGTSCNFKEAEDRILAILEQVPATIHLEFLPGQISFPRGGGHPKFLQNVTETPLNGASISIQGNNKDAGSLGGWVWLNIPHRNIRTRCAITCYHVVRPMDDATSTHTDRNGVIPNDPRGHVTVEYPAACDVAYTMKDLSELYKNYPNEPAVTTQYNILSARMANPGIGKVILASGRRRRGNSKVNWALIESPTTFTANKPPPRSAFDRFSLPHGSAYFVNSDTKVRAFGQAKFGDWVAKFGRTSKTTSGEVNKLDREVIWPTGSNSYEMEIISYDGYFSEPGDTGSAVTNSKGEFVGLLFARDSHPAQYVSYMTPISLIQDDVNEMTDGGFLSLN
ncbi:hypothetical protein FQN49_005576 [Arthroderma sp. PD_2]|nr:hypothetical protein FQN49_005576 [Arthroderma sp. PD_2]